MEAIEIELQRGKHAEVEYETKSDMYEHGTMNLNTESLDRG